MRSTGKTRRRLAAELTGELEATGKTRALDKELTGLVTARGSALMRLHGIGPWGAARLLSDVGDIHRFASRDRFASWNGTAPLDASSGSQARHRLSRAGNRRINRVLHIMAVVQLRNQTEGRAYYDARRAGGMPSMMAMRALKRRLSNVVFSPSQVFKLFAPLGQHSFIPEEIPGAGVKRGFGLRFRVGGVFCRAC